MKKQETAYILRNEGIRTGCLSFIRELPLTALWEVVIREYQPKRSLAQNRLYWRWMRELSNGYDDTRGKRYSPEAWHEHFKRSYLGQRVIELPLGGHKTVDETTTDLGVRQFSEYLGRVEQDAIELGIDLTHTVDYHLAMYGQRENAEEATDHRETEEKTMG